MKKFSITKSDLHSTAKVMFSGTIILGLILDMIAASAIIVNKLRGNNLRASILHVFSTYTEFWRNVFMKASSYFNWMLMKISDLR